ncbi:LOW QUALITY PROTEIN: uncharacterized protein LOC119089378 [Pollicipes pollicipes]|uniref:LOW QUALITY PROTEIN: uncharacterized protein LOC119089378 n=1 Tax=Pollicipes pollicipes TaxID=41117 RepID=UPI001885238C|nr:LOW QUALITY PROTEIN: uncharacterized protein LOC119089378 [Pollicipes pollicipes]
MDSLLFIHMFYREMSGDSLSYGSQPEYVHYVNPPPLGGLGPYSWADSTSGTSQELYFRGQRKYFRRSFCSVCLSVSIVTVIIAVIGIVAIAAYLGVMTTDDSEALKYEMQYTGKFRVARGDFFHPSLSDTTSADFKDKAERYKRMIETLYGYSYLSDAFRRASVERFGNDSLTVFFRVHLDRRKIPTSVLNTEEAVRDVVTQEVMSLEPRALRAVTVDIDSIEIQRENKEGASNAAFIAGGGGGSRLQESAAEAPARAATASPAAEPPERPAASSSSAPPPSRPEASSSTARPRPEVALSRPEAAPQQTAPVSPADQEESVTSEPAATPAVSVGDDVKAYDAGFDPSDAARPAFEDQAVSQAETQASREPEPQGAPTESVEVTVAAEKPEMSQEISHDMPENMSEDMSSKMSDGILGGTSEDFTSEATTTDEVTSTEAIIKADMTETPADAGAVVEGDAPTTAAPVLSTEPPAESAPVTADLLGDYTEPEHAEQDYDIARGDYADDVATELAPLLAAGVALGVDRVGYVDATAAGSVQSALPAGQKPYYADVQVGTAYFGGLAPAPSGRPVAPVAGSPNVALARPEQPELVEGPAASAAVRPVVAGDGGPVRPLYDYSPWNPIIPAFAQSPNPVERPAARPRPGAPLFSEEWRPTVAAGSVLYRTEFSTSEVREMSTAETPEPQRRIVNGGAQMLLLDPPTAQSVDRMGIAFAERRPTRRPMVAPTASATTQHVLVVNAAPVPMSDAPRPLATVTRPALQPVTSYSGVYPPSRPRPPSAFAQSTLPPAAEATDTEPSRLERDDEDAATPTAPSPTSAAAAAAPSREQLLSLFRLIALRYPALVANMDQQQLRVLLNDEEARRRLLAPFIGQDKSRTPSEHQRNNTKFLVLENIAVNSTRSNRRGKSHALPRQLTHLPALPPPTRRPISAKTLNSSVLLALANLTRVKVAGGLSTATRAPSASSLSDRLLQLTGFPTRAPPRGVHTSTPLNSREKLSDKLMRFHGERTDANGGCLEPTDFACRTLGGCVPALSRCDRLLDCADGSDERDCTCADRLRAQSLHRKLCDGVVDCHDSSDEQMCEWCRPDQFICPEAKQCVDRSAICDGHYDCADGADERRCVTIAADVAQASAPEYRPEGLLLVRKRGVWGRLCADQLERTARQIKGRWAAQELGRAVCKALTYQDAKQVRSVGPETPPAETADKLAEPFYRLLYSPSSLLPESEKASLVFAEERCPRQTALHVTCDQLRCGLRPRIKQRQARIVGGGNTSPGAWPWQAAMYRDGEYQCGATLISDRWLVSAGHCYLRSTRRFWLARLGAYRRGSSLLSPHERLHAVSHVIMHPDYQDVGYVHDIALLRLKEPAQMSDFVRPVCLPSPNAPIQDGALCTVVGWGQLFESGRIFPDTLQEVQLPLISSQECKKRTVFLPLYRITENMFCAGYERGGRDACLGDSGGPLMCQEPSGEWTLAGVTSNGYGCARAGRPGVYTKVANYAQWIDQVTAGRLPSEQRHGCQGHRCPLGRCLPASDVCDGVVHCSDGSDEQRCPAAGAS